MSEDQERKRKQKRKRVIAWSSTAAICLLITGASIFGSMQSKENAPESIATSEVVKMINDGKVDKATIADNVRSITVTDQDGKEFSSNYPAQYSETLTKLLIDKGAEVETASSKMSPGMILLDSFLSILPLLLIAGFLIWSIKTGFFNRMMGRMRSGAGEIVEIPDVTFDDVAGCPEAVAELSEMVEFIKDGDRFKKLGAQAPKGALLCGPPGTGKTLLARAVAGTAGVPFIAVSGSDFMEMFVGVGASRVSKIFETIRERGEGIIFIDEIDVIGAKRNSNSDPGGGTQERENTLNQLLTELDGFNARGKIIVLAATNRPDILDDALVRPGRLDRKIEVLLPDRKGREEVLKVHARGKPIDPTVNFEHIASETQNMSGAELAQVVNEATMVAARRDGNIVTVDDFQSAIHTVILGRAKTSAYLSKTDKELTAWHEAGHAVVAMVLSETSKHPEPPIFATLIPRGPAGGFTKTDTQEDHYLYRTQALERLAMMMGGRQAEIILLGEDDYTSGASSDFQNATKLAEAMVWRLSMTKAVTHTLPDDQRYDMTDDSKTEEVQKLIQEASYKARQILTSEKGGALLKLTADALIENESLNREQLDDIRKGVKI